MRHFNKLDWSILLSLLFACVLTVIAACVQPSGPLGAPNVVQMGTVSSVQMTLAQSTLAPGGTTQATAVARSADGTVVSGPVDFSSQNPLTATVSSKGVVTALTTGVALIRAAVASHTASATVTVTSVLSPVAVVAVRVDSATLLVGHVAHASAMAKDTIGNVITGQVVTWTSLTPGIATISSSGAVTAAAPGPAIIQGMISGTAGLDTIVVVVQNPSWPNEPLGNTPILDYLCSVDLPIQNDFWAGYPNWYLNNPTGTLTRITDLSAPLSAPYVWQQHYPIGFTPGHSGVQAVYDFVTPRKEIYVGMWLKVSDPWQSPSAGPNKIFYIMGATGPSELSFQFFSPSGLEDGRPYRLDTITEYQNGGESTTRRSPNVNTTEFTLGTWHRLELYLKYSDPGTANGLMKWWMDGILQGNYSNVQNDSDAGFQNFNFTPDWGGSSTWNKTEDDYLYVDHIYVSHS